MLFFPKACIACYYVLLRETFRIRSFSGPYFSAFGVNTDRYKVFQSERGKKLIRKTLNTDTFPAVIYCSTTSSNLGIKDRIK